MAYVGRLLIATSAASVLYAAVALPASSSPIAIVPGQSIGPIRLGMALEDVRRALGGPGLVSKRQERGFGSTYLELQYGYGRYVVGLAGSRQRLRVVRVATFAASQRTAEGLGVGSQHTELLRAFPRVRCTTTEEASNRQWRRCTIVSRLGRRTTFTLAPAKRWPWSPPDWANARIVEVAVSAT